MPSNVTVIYHYEDGSWWADSPDVERWSAAATELEDLVPLVMEGVPFALEVEDVEIAHRPAPDLLDVFAGRSVGNRLRTHISEAFEGLLSAPQVAVPEEMVPVACGS